MTGTDSRSAPCYYLATKSMAVEVSIAEMSPMAVTLYQCYPARVTLRSSIGVDRPNRNSQQEQQSESRLSASQKSLPNR